MEREAALGVIRQSAREEDMRAKLELQSREQIVELIGKGYFDPLLGEIEGASHRRAVQLSSASRALAEHFRIAIPEDRS